MSTNHYKAEDGYRYYRGEKGTDDYISTDELWLGINDSIDNWTLITVEEDEKIKEEIRVRIEGEMDLGHE